jgi:hypothetical protein
MRRGVKEIDHDCVHATSFEPAAKLRSRAIMACADSG